MSREEIENEIYFIEKELLGLLEPNIEHFILDDRDIPIFSILKKQSIGNLRILHIRINTLLEYARTLIEIEEISHDKNIYKCLLLKSHIESLVQLHPQFSHKKYPGTYKYKLDIQKGNNFIVLNRNIVSNPPKFLSALYNLTINNNKVLKSTPQRRAFVSLFYPFKAEEELKWCGPVYTLRRFFDRLAELNLIEKNKYFNSFISQSCLIKDKSGNFTKFKTNSFKTSNNKVGYQEVYNDWNHLESLVKR